MDTPGRNLTDLGLALSLRFCVVVADAGQRPVAVLFGYWFADKNDLLEALITRAVQDLENAAVARAAQGSDTPDILTALRATWRVVESDEPGLQLSLFELTTGALRTPGMSELAAQQYRLYRQLTAQAVAP